jgi:hypothetical protein
VKIQSPLDIRLIVPVAAHNDSDDGAIHPIKSFFQIDQSAVQRDRAFFALVNQALQNEPLLCAASAQAKATLAVQYHLVIGLIRIDGKHQTLELVKLVT